MENCVKFSGYASKNCVNVFNAWEFIKILFALLTWNFITYMYNI